MLFDELDSDTRKRLLKFMAVPRTVKAVSLEFKTTRPTALRWLGIADMSTTHRLEVLEQPEREGARGPTSKAYRLVPR